MSATAASTAGCKYLVEGVPVFSFRAAKAVDELCVRRGDLASALTTARHFAHGRL